MSPETRTAVAFQTLSPVKGSHGTRIAFGSLMASLRRFAVLACPARSRSGVYRSDPDTLAGFAGLHSLHGTVQEACHAECFGAAAHIVVIQVVIRRLPLDEGNAKHTTPLVCLTPLARAKPSDVAPSESFVPNATADLMRRLKSRQRKDRDP